MGMKYTVYVLSSISAKKSYVGFTNDLKKRLEQHNQGLSTYTKVHGPWKVIYTEVYNNREDANKREKYLKSASGRKRVMKNLFEKI